MNDTDKNEKLPVHLILGANRKNYVSIVVSQDIVSLTVVFQKTCSICKNKYHASICDKSLSTSTEFLPTATISNVI